MKLPKLVIATIVFILFQLSSFAQPVCGYDVIHNKRMKEDPAYRKKVQENEANIRRYIDAHKDLPSTRVNGISTVLYTIPIVVHIVHTGGEIGSAYNPPDEQIIGAVNELNQTYNGTKATPQGIGDVQIQFVLAQRDAYCNPSTGIDRVNGAALPNYIRGGVNLDSTSGTDVINVINLSNWPSSEYINIWVVNRIDGNDGTSAPFTAGFSYYPGPPPYDGIILLDRTMMAGSFDILPHEMGHALDLRHVFEGGDYTNCPPYSSTDPSVAQTTGDLIEDTDPITIPLFNRLGTVNNCTIDAGNPAGNVYTINTELNIMGYGEQDLFTAGQKARMLAAAAGPYRISMASSSGGIPTNDPSNGCAPAISFDRPKDLAQETTAVTSGCRAYKDYTYNIDIANNPNIPATVTLMVESGGSATEGTDFDITTNGDFSAPSKTVLFLSGRSVPQPFTVRIYDDAIVDGTETFTLGFTVDNGGGNAVKSNGRNAFTFTILDNDTPLYGPLPTTTNPFGYSSNYQQGPFDGSKAKLKMQILYRQAELIYTGMKSGNIIGFSMNILKNSSPDFVYAGATIKMAQTSQNSLANGSTEFPLNESLFTTVYSPGSYATVNGLNSFIFSTPFAWDGISNIVIETCYDNGATTSGADYVAIFPDGSDQKVDVFQPGINCAGNFTAISNLPGSAKPYIEFMYQDPGTQVQTATGMSKQEYLGPGADVYFYDATGSVLLARINNTSTFDYGCTQVIADRSMASAGTGAVPFQNNSPANYLLSKTVKVVPAINNPSGSYDISLYYTQAEIDAWQMATGQSINNAQLIKVTNQVADVTPAHPDGGGAISAVLPSVSMLGTNTVLTGSFSTGFSGFGAGVAGLALPIRLLDFNGVLRGGSGVLSWSTSSEINSKDFDIERSYDGIVFNKAGTVTAAGNSSVTRYYSFIDPVLVQESNYYRLKQVDLDGKFEYSKVILIKNPGNHFRVINNPFTDVIDVAFGKIQSDKVDIRLLDVTGKEIYHVAGNASGQSTMRVNLAGRNISAGIYLLQVKTNQEQFIQRVMKQ